MHLLSVIASPINTQNLFSLFFHPKNKANPKCTEQVVTRGHLVMGDRIIDIYNGPNGRFYSVAGDDGTTFDVNLSEAQLQNHYPDIYQQIHLYLAII